MSPNQEQDSPKRVRYASYGSNLQRERFMCYIEGGTPEGSAKRNEGCRDKSEPEESRPISLNFELYFAGRFRRWGNGALAFIRENPKGYPTLGRMYQITDEQLNDLVLQENESPVTGCRCIPAFNQLVGQREFRLSGNPWYGKLLNIGSEGGYPVLTFTTARAELQAASSPPSEQYVKVIASGIKETYPEMSDDDIVEYLLRADGLRGKIDPLKIQTWVAEA
jgi:hypothetical protein